MQAWLFIQSLWIGLAVAAPVGPIGVLVIQRTLRHGVRVGLATGLGAAVADAAYGAVGAYGVSGLIAWLQGARVPLALAGGAFLLRAGLAHLVAAPPATGRRRGRVRRLLPTFAGAVALTLSNPATILSFVAIFGALAGAGAPASPGLMVAGVLAGSALWWLLLCGAVGVLRGRFDARWQRRVGARLGADAGRLRAVAVGGAAGTVAAVPHDAGNDRAPPRRGPVEPSADDQLLARCAGPDGDGLRRRLWRAICSSAADGVASMSTLPGSPASRRRRDRGRRPGGGGSAVCSCEAPGGRWPGSMERTLGSAHAALPRPCDEAPPTPGRSATGGDESRRFSRAAGDPRSCLHGPSWPARERARSASTRACRQARHRQPV